MNLALFINQENFQDLEDTIDSLVSRTSDQHNGAVVLVYHNFIEKAQIIPLANKLAPRFKSVNTLPIDLNVNMKKQGKEAQAFAQFLVNAYSRYPGPWMVIDSYTEFTKDDVLNYIEKTHRSLGKLVSGRGRTSPGSVIAIGPIVIELDGKSLAVLKHPVSEGWRSRGQFIFGRHFGLIPAEEYPFSIDRVRTHKPVPGPDLEPTLVDPVVKETPLSIDPQIEAVVPAVIQTNSGKSVVDEGKGEEGGPRYFHNGFERDGVFTLYTESKKVDLLEALTFFGVKHPHPATGNSKLAALVTESYNK